MLSRDLFRELDPAFLRLLGTPGVRLYLDAVDVLDSESALRTGELEREEALKLVERIVEQHQEVELEEASGLGTREKARLLIERLVEARWLSAENRVDYQRFIAVEPNATLFLEVLRKIARPDALEFSDKLVATCNLLRSSALRDEPWQTIESCTENVRQGVQELKTVTKSVERHTQLQLAAKSLHENLEIVFDQYAEQVGHSAYAELVRSRLPSRLPEAREIVEQLQGEPESLSKMAAELSRRDGSGHGTAMSRVRQRLHDLAQALDRVIPCADEVDRRTADFTRKSLARFRYLQEVTGENRATVQMFFEKLNAHFAGRRVADAETEIADLPTLSLIDIKLPAGLESLRFPALRRSLGEIEPLDDEPSKDMLDRAERQLAATLRDSLTVSRANRFAADAFEKHGPSVPSKLLLRTDDDLADLIACLLHASARDARYRIVLSRELDLDSEATEHRDTRQYDLVLAGTRSLEHFDLVKK